MKSAHLLGCSLLVAASLLAQMGPPVLEVQRYTQTGQWETMVNPGEGASTVRFVIHSAPGSWVSLSINAYIPTVAEEGMDQTKLDGFWAEFSPNGELAWLRNPAPAELTSLNAWSPSIFAPSTAPGLIDPRLLDILLSGVDPLYGATSNHDVRNFFQPVLAGGPAQRAWSYAPAAWESTSSWAQLWEAYDGGQGPTSFDVLSLARLGVFLRAPSEDIAQAFLGMDVPQGEVADGPFNACLPYFRISAIAMSIFSLDPNYEAPTAESPTMPGLAAQANPLTTKAGFRSIPTTFGLVFSSPSNGGAGIMTPAPQGLPIGVTVIGGHLPCIIGWPAEGGGFVRQYLTPDFDMYNPCRFTNVVPTNAALGPHTVSVRNGANLVNPSFHTYLVIAPIPYP